MATGEDERVRVKPPIINYFEIYGMDTYTSIKCWRA